jgi:hypothetical protein
LPSAVLEITPGFLSQFIARCWGFSGPALCLVGDASVEAEVYRLLQACEDSARAVCLVRVRGDEEHREVEWHV